MSKLLAQSYWANNRDEARTARAIANSDCFGVYFAGELVGFARVVSDSATTFYMCDVIIDSRHRSMGLGAPRGGAMLRRPPKTHSSIPLKKPAATRDVHKQKKAADDESSAAFYVLYCQQIQTEKPRAEGGTQP